MFHYFVTVKENLGYINSYYSDVRCKIYMRVFLFGLFLQRTNPWIGNVGLYNWFSYSYFTYCLILYSYVLIFTIHLFCTRVSDMHATWPYHMYSLGCFLTILNSHVQILEFEPWWPYYNWSECVEDPSMTIRAQQKFGHRRSSSPDWLPRPLMLFVSTSQLLLCISLSKSYFIFSGDVIFL